MNKQLRVYFDSDGNCRVKCPRCDEKIVPDKKHLFEGYDCPECAQVIDSKILRNYLKVFSDSETPDGGLRVLGGEGCR